MTKTSKKILILVTVLSLCLNAFFAIQYYQEQVKKRNNLIDATERVSVRISDASDRLTTIDKDSPDYENHIIGAARDIAIRKGWIEAYAEDMPRNLVSWIGGIEVGLSNGAYGIDENGFKHTVQDLKNFTDGYYKESESLNQDPEETLKIMEDVLSSKKYMGDNYIKK